MRITDLRGFAAKAKTTDTQAVTATAKAIDAHVLTPADRGTLIDQELAKGAELSVIRLVDALIERAYSARSSDVHLDPRRDGLVVRLRIDGVLQDAHTLPPGIHGEVISR